MTSPKKLEAFEIAASRQKSRIEVGLGSSQLEAHMASYDSGSSQEKARPAKRQRHSRRAALVSPSEMRDLPHPEPLPACILDPFISSRPQPDPRTPSDAQPTQTGETGSAMNVQSSSPGTLVPSSSSSSCSTNLELRDRSKRSCRCFRLCQRNLEPNRVPSGLASTGLEGTAGEVCGKQGKRNCIGGPTAV